MKKSVKMTSSLLAALVGSLSATAAATCQYPLDATAAQYAAYGQLQMDAGASQPDLPFPYIALQSAGFTATYLQPPQAYVAFSNAALQSYLDLNAGTGTTFGDITLPTSGIVAFEVNVDRFPPTDGVDTWTTGSDLGFNVVLVAKGYANGQVDSFNLAVAFRSASFGSPHTYFASFGAYSQEGGVQASTPGNGGYALPQPLPANYRAGLYLNMNTRQVGATLNGVDLGYATKADGTPLTIPVSVQSALLSGIGTNLVRTATSPNIGQALQFTLVTDKSQFTQPFPAGTNDLCSTDGGNGVTLPNGKPFPGKGKALGLQNLQPLLLPGARGMASKP